MNTTTRPEWANADALAAAKQALSSLSRSEEHGRRATDHMLRALLACGAVKWTKATEQEAGPLASQVRWNPEGTLVAKWDADSAAGKASQRALAVALMTGQAQCVSCRAKWAGRNVPADVLEGRKDHNGDPLTDGSDVISAKDAAYWREVNRITSLISRTVVGMDRPSGKAPSKREGQKTAAEKRAGSQREESAQTPAVPTPEDAAATALATLKAVASNRAQGTTVAQRREIRAAAARVVDPAELRVSQIVSALKAAMDVNDAALLAACAAYVKAHGEASQAAAQEMLTV